MKNKDMNKHELKEVAETLNKISKAITKPVVTVKGYKATRKYFMNTLEEINRRKLRSAV